MTPEEMKELRATPGCGEHQTPQSALWGAAIWECDECLDLFVSAVRSSPREPGGEAKALEAAGNAIYAALPPVTHADADKAARAVLAALPPLRRAPSEDVVRLVANQTIIEAQQAFARFTYGPYKNPSRSLAESAAEIVARVVASLTPARAEPSEEAK